MDRVAGLFDRVPKRVAKTLGVPRLVERWRLSRMPMRSCDPIPLQSRERLPLKEILQVVDEGEWAGICDAMSSFEVPDGTGGVNPGDRRAIYALVRYLQPRRILEIGTHIAASTIHLAMAMQRNGWEDEGKLVSVDLRDVNDREARPWEAHGTTLAPDEMIRKLGVERHVEFVTSASVDYLSHTETRFDLVFLDGDHAAAAVYEEVPAALRVLSPGGCILLHDYFPGEQPLWSDGTVIHGPALALARLESECQVLTTIPLGDLPWPTKFGSRATSLALVAARHSPLPSAEDSASEIGS